MKTGQRLLLVSGEISSDRYASHLASALKRCDPTVTLYGVGGAKTKAVVDHFLADIAHQNAIGISESFKKKSFMKQLSSQLEELLVKTPIDGVVMLDFPHYNFQLASLFQSFQLPIVTFITPNFWIWGQKKQAKALAAYSRDVITIFNKEYTFYKSFCRHVHYYGHPLVELTQSPKPLALSEPYRIGIMPGSRKQEINYHLPMMLESVKRLQAHHNIEVRLAISSSRFTSQVEAIVKRSGVSVQYCNAGPDVFFKDIHTLLTVAGTTTLEAVLYDVPQVIVGKLSPFTYVVAKYILRIHLPLIGLPNVILGKRAIPEFKQFEMNVPDVSDALLALKKEGARKKLRTHYERVKKALVVSGHVFDDVARCVLGDVKERLASRRSR